MLTKNVQRIESDQATDHFYKMTNTQILYKRSKRDGEKKKKKRKETKQIA